MERVAWVHCVGAFVLLSWVGRRMVCLDEWHARRGALASSSSLLVAGSVALPLDGMLQRAGRDGEALPAEAAAGRAQRGMPVGCSIGGQAAAAGACAAPQSARVPCRAAGGSLCLRWVGSERAD